ncbi:unnamed protein product [Gadus morhua 'NCC']
MAAVVTNIIQSVSGSMTRRGSSKTGYECEEALFHAGFTSAGVLSSSAEQTHHDVTRDMKRNEKETDFYRRL